jgi:hypothetical protein
MQNPVIYVVFEIVSVKSPLLFVVVYLANDSPVSSSSERDSVQQKQGKEWW